MYSLKMQYGRKQGILPDAMICHAKIGYGVKQAEPSYAVYDRACIKRTPVSSTCSIGSNGLEERLLKMKKQ